MTTYQENIIINALANIIFMEFSGKRPEKGHGLQLKNTWITPETCYTLAKVIEEHNDKTYGEGNWNLDKEVIRLLKGGTN